MNRTHIATALFALLVGALTPAHGDIDLVTLPAKDYVQLTVYNSVDLTLARERRTLTFREGLNRIQFSWANTLIDPSSLQFRILSHPAELDVLDTTYPPGRAQTLQWNVSSEHAGPVQVEISYFTSGITWAANYVGVTNHDETEMTFKGYVRMTNNSGEEYEQARTRLLVGNVHLLQNIADLARGHYRDFTPQQREAAVRHFLDAEARYQRMAQGSGSTSEGIAREGLSEYFLFTVKGQETVRNTWSKQLPAVSAVKVPIETYYRVSDMTTGGKVLKFCKFANRPLGAANAQSVLGRAPLPNGAVRVFTQLPSGDLSYVGADSMAYAPVGDRVVWNLGEDRDLTVERKLTDYRRTNIRLDRFGNVSHYDEHFYYETRIHNGKGKPVRLEVERQIPHHHAVDELQGAESIVKVDGQARKYHVDLKPNEVRVVRYHVLAKH